MEKETDLSKINTTEEKGIWKNIGGFGIALLLALAIRALLFEPYNIPSGSMIPSLLIGDYLFISKYDYGYSRHSFPFSLPIIPNGRIFDRMPKQGDVVVFRMTPEIQPTLESSIDYIKRVIALPGDTVQMKNGRLYVNDVLVAREPVSTEQMKIENQEITYTKYIETLPNGVKHDIFEIADNLQADNTDKITVPQGHFFAMGDNRDNSLDSRFFGPVPLVNLEGKARFIFYSNNGKGSFWQFWKWGEFIRKERIFNKIY